MKKVFELDFYGRKIVVENGQLAKQADGAVLVRYGDTVVLSTAVVSKSANLLSVNKIALCVSFVNTLVLLYIFFIFIKSIQNALIPDRFHPRTNQRSHNRLLPWPHLYHFP